MTTGRRASLIAAAVTWALAMVVARGGASVERASAGAQDRPNVIVVMSDDQAARWQRYMPVVNSRIGDRGATFGSSFTNWPLCCPSRATFLTGQYARNHDVRGNSPPGGSYTRFKALHGDNNLAIWMQDAGYYTGHVGKYLNGYGTEDPAEVPPGWDKWYGATGGTQAVYDYALNQNGTLVPYGNHAADFKGDVLTGKAVRFIRRRAPKPQPFFLFVGYTAPHTGGPNPNPRLPFNCNNTAKPAPRHANAFNDEPLPQPPNFNEADVTDKPQAIQELPPLVNGEIRSLRRTYRCRIESLLHIDEGVGEMLDTLKREGELGNTVVIYTSDNGFFRGEHRIRNGKNRVYEEAISVPLLMRGPGIPRDVVVRDLAINADLAATITDVAGATPGLTPDGRSLMPAARNPTVQRGRELLIEKTALNDEGEPDDPNSFVGIRNRRYSYIEYGPPNSERELYDLASDPFQLASKHDDPAYDEVEAALAARLTALRDCSGESCNSRPDLNLELDFAPGHENGHACAERPVRARVDGADQGDIDTVGFAINGDLVGSDAEAPFERRLSYPKLKERIPSAVRVVVDMVDGRRLTVDRNVRVCG